MATTETPAPNQPADQNPATTDPHTMRAAVYLVFERGDKILLSHRSNSGYHDGEYGVPTGHIEDGEPASGAAIRKAEEEVGVKIRMSELRLVHVMHRSSGSDKTKDYIDFYFLVLNFAGEPINKIPRQCSDLKWVKWNELPTNTVPEVRYALERIKEDKIYSEFDFLAE
ncbi:MAG TPA: NUDIX domain-containing protein [Candidatus Saccharimonadales bacterium]|nr:NUDIX domain-containing protein [Candidatus Saccharimonadales bacterium]